MNAAAITKTTRKPAEHPLALAQNGGYLLSHDGVHWSGSFHKILALMIDDQLEDAPLTMRFLIEPEDDKFEIVSGLVVARRYGFIVFQDNTQILQDHVLAVSI